MMQVLKDSFEYNLDETNEGLNFEDLLVYSVNFETEGTYTY